MQLNSLVSDIKSIGAEREKKLNRLGIFNIMDLILYFPRDYDDRSDVKKISGLIKNETNTFIAKIDGQAENIRIKNRIITRVKLSDETGSIHAIWYNQQYLKSYFTVGDEYIVTGKVNIKYSKNEIISPEFEKTNRNETLSGGRIIPIYSLTGGMSQKMLRGLIKDTLDKASYLISDFLPIWLKKRYEICERGFAISNIHFPNDNESFFIARRRLVFEELFMFQLGLSRLKLMYGNGKKGAIFKNLEGSEKIIEKMAFELTSAQKNVMREIFTDIESGKLMNRLIQGDVGSGKTAIAMITAFVAIQNGYQSALMVPTEVLASQHFDSISSLFSEFGIRTVILSGNLTTKEKKETLKCIANGEAQMIIGTHAIIQKNVTFNNLALIITDEQHRFGVKQRGILSEKGDNPHVLVMTATPIPRTLALILYGDLDISIIDELPPGRKTVDTRTIQGSYRERVFDFIKKEVDKGRQAYIVCPAIEESETLDIKAATTYYENISEGAFKDYKAELLHGKMKAKEKQDIMNRFTKNEINILVSTTVIEVGINVPNATIMLIENAERFGLAQLHQLRGRVGRGADKSYCILITESKNELTKKRMEVMQRTNDGFEISETDLELRGPGEFFGTRQHGLPEMKIANLYKDISILKEAQNAVQDLMSTDKNLDKEEHKLLYEESLNIFENGSINI